MAVDHEPGYVAVWRSGELARRAEQAEALLRGCVVCPRRCGVNRLAGDHGVCRGGRLAAVASWGAHHGEEAPLSGRGGSGTIFFSGCSLQCVYCQNADTSQGTAGQTMRPEELAGVMLALQDAGCHNINLVTPTHFVPQILRALFHAAEGGLRLPLVYNTGGYDSLETLRLLDGIIDVYLPDLKYMDEAVGRRLSKVRHYPQVAMAAIAEMHRQVGDLQVGPDGIARRGLLARHLVLPDGLAGTAEAMCFLAGLSPQACVNVMEQYRPAYRAARFAEVNRRPTEEERDAARAAARNVGLCVKG